LAADDTRTRNGEPVQVERYQQTPAINWFGPHITLVWGSDGRLVSFNDFSVTSQKPLPKPAEARQIAVNTFQTLDATYAAGLQYMRTDHLVRQFMNAKGTMVDIPVWWVKFAHVNGSYNWVSVGAGGQIVEVERESLWSYTGSRRATEEWNYDDWVLARMGQGPQPSAPAALA
jgi:hypothetical protein